MTITVLDTDAAMAGILAADPDARPDRVRAMLAPMAGMFRWLPGSADLAAMHAMSLGFPLDRDEDRTAEALRALRDARAWDRIRHALDEAVAIQRAATPDVDVPDITVSLVLGDVGDAYLMGPARGLIGNGSATGFLSLTLWPTEENLARLEAAAVHELHHNLRYAPGGVVWDPATVDVGEQIVAEGLADAFATQLHGPVLGPTPIGAQHRCDDALLARVAEGLEVTGMQRFAGWVLGDPAAVRFGSEPVGLPAGAGYALGGVLVEEYLAATGMRAADALHARSRDVIDVALGGLPRLNPR